MRYTRFLVIALALTGCTEEEKTDPETLPIGGVLQVTRVETTGGISANAYAEFYGGYEDGIERYVPDRVLDVCWDPMNPAPTPTPDPPPSFPIMLDVGPEVTLSNGAVTHVLPEQETGVYVSYSLTPPPDAGSEWTLSVQGKTYAAALAMPPSLPTIVSPAGTPAVLPSSGPLLVEWTPMNAEWVFLALRKAEPGSPNQAPRRYCIAMDDGSFEFSATDVAAVGTAGYLSVSGLVDRSVDFNGRRFDLNGQVTLVRPFVK